MAINWNDTYPNTETASPDYPFGGIKNETAAGALDGTPLEKAGYSDLIGWLQAAMQAAGEVPSNNPETAQASQVLDAIINHRWYQYTNYDQGTRVIGSDGQPYRSLQASGPSTTTVDPVTEPDPRAYWQPEEQYFNDKAHPIGSIYMSSDPTDPATVLGVGTWARIQGRFIVGASDTDGDFNNGDTGGSKTHSHTTQSAGGHVHNIDTSDFGAFGGSPGTIPVGRVVTGSGNPELSETLESLRYASTTNATETAGSHTHTVNSSSNLPPYVAKYIWERTA